MADYDLERLGPSEFEHLAQALAVRYFGPDIRIYGAGPDGGREAAFSKDVSLPGGTAWTGLTIVQAKHRARVDGPGSNYRWLRAQVYRELVAWTSRRDDVRRPDNMLIVTNVKLSSVPGHDIDSLDKLFGEFADRLPLAGYAIWHYDHLCRLLDDSPGIRKAFSGLLTPGDVFAAMHDLITRTSLDIGTILRRHAAKELLAEQWVRLSQLGLKSTDRIPLARVATDLAAARSHAPSEAERRVHAARYICAIGNRVLRPSHRPGPSPHLVLIGGPGQGKTTIGQIVCQAYRVALLERAANLPPQITEAVTALQNQLDAMKIDRPALLRWPLRIDLNRFADAIARDDHTSLLRFVAQGIAARSEEHVSSADVRGWLGHWPWMLVLDGLDEVAAPRVRELLVERINDFFVDAADVDADLLVVVTTRPRGYAGEFTPEHYEHLTMADLTPAEALDYARLLADVRHGEDPDVHRNVLERIEEAAKNELTFRLLRTPLQITIMSLLLEGRSRVPHNRYGLFDAYYETVYNREVGKNNATARTLEQHRRIVNELHEDVGLVLQVQAEESGHAEPAISMHALRAMVRERLLDDEFVPVEADALTDDLIRIATHRLVLLMPVNDADVGFEVRSLQEFMAARAIVKGKDSQILRSMERLAPSSHWRNTWLLAAGRLAAVRNHLVDDLIALLHALDAQSYLMMQIAPGSDLALDLLDDGFGTASPRIERLLLKHAVEVFRRPPDLSTAHAADALHRVFGEKIAAAARVEDVARQTLAGAPPQKITAAIIMRQWSRTAGPLGSFARKNLRTLRELVGPSHHLALQLHFLGIVGPGPSEALDSAGTLADYLLLPSEIVDPLDQALLDELHDALRATEVHLVATEEQATVTAVPHLVMPSQLILERALTSDTIADLFADSIRSKAPEEWPVASALAVIAAQWLLHKQVGQRLLE
ncbi:NACHT domain-containing protein [Dactylosporangium cerinum]